MCARAPSTTSKFAACWKKWLLWANSKSNVPSFPVQPYHLCLYISHLSNVSGAKSSADSLIASVKWAHSLAGVPSPTDDPMVKTAVQGYNRLHASPVCRKEPITPDILFKLFASHGHANASLADLRILFICFVSYAGFLCYDDISRLRRSDCFFHPDKLVLHLLSSKTDQFLGDASDSVLPVIHRFTHSKRGLIATSHGLSYTRTREIVLHALKPLVPDISKFGLHSLRSGGASSASNINVPPFLISQHGRWKTEKARDTYIKSDPKSTLLPTQSLGLWAIYFA